jgi:hypothetical protein
MIVNVVSIELEKVLVEQYHCQGLNTVIHIYKYYQLGQ